MQDKCILTTWKAAYLGNEGELKEKRLGSRQKRKGDKNKH